MKTTKFALPLLLLLTIPSSSEEMESFRDLQWKYARVRIASKEKDEVLRQRFKEKALAYPPRAILLRAFKQEGLLELWAAGAADRPYELVPEGFYELDWFNPQSNFFLSLHISYPNASDRIRGSHKNPGGDIFLHGNCASIGCIPITDDGIKEVYWLAVQVHNRDQQHLPIQIFPARLTDEGLKALATAHSHQEALIAFWSNLKEGYDFFEKNHRLPRVKTRADGAYAFSPM